MKEALVFDTPDGIAYARLATLKAKLKLEQAGMKTTGGALRPRLAEEFKLPARAPHSLYINHCINEMSKILIRQPLRGGNPS